MDLYRDMAEMKYHIGLLVMSVFVSVMLTWVLTQMTGLGNIQSPSQSGFSHRY